MDFSADTTFNAALPYAGGSLAVAVTGAVVAVTATATVIQVAAIAAAVFGAYAFVAVVVTGVNNAGNPDKFREEVPKAIGVAFGTAVADICVSVAKQVLFTLVDDWLGRRRA